ncbi:MAG TPA: non-homologous end-joining DNA ligase [Acidimicrobiales bacterium]|nr:non-homologous end-joining DNA ligase [Acidimicrobiales bacterium]
MARMPRGLVPMLATAGLLPKNEDGWAFEVKWDGVRGLTYVEGGEFKMESRNLKDFTPRYPEVWPLAEQLGGRDAILDGEVVAFDERGRPSFGTLQNRMHLVNAAEVRRMMVEVPVLYLIFDLLWLDGESLMKRPYHERRAALEGLGLGGSSWKVSATQEGGGSALLDAARSQGLEGVVGKKLESTYEPGARSKAWIKTKVKCDQELVVGGWMPGEGNRVGRIGALLVGYYEGDDLRFAGRVGSGFSDKTLTSVGQQLDALARDDSPFADHVPYRDARFVEPRLVAQVEFTEWTHLNTLRHPVFKGLRDDKDARAVVRE